MVPITLLTESTIPENSKFENCKHDANKISI